MVWMDEWHGWFRILELWNLNLDLGFLIKRELGVCIFWPWEEYAFGITMTFFDSSVVFKNIDISVLSSFLTI
jgi:hypothetical protein